MSDMCLLQPRGFIHEDPDAQKGECALKADFELKDHVGIPPDRLIKRAIFDAEKNIAHAKKVLEDVIVFWEKRMADAQARCNHNPLIPWKLPESDLDVCETCGATVNRRTMKPLE